MEMNRKLDGIYFRVCRDGKWQDICFSDLTRAEQDEVLEGRDMDFLKGMCHALAETIKGIGDELDIVREP